MIIKTTLSELEVVIYKYSDLLAWEKGFIIPDSDDDAKRLGISGYRIQVPELNLSVRIGYLMMQEGGEYHERSNPETGEHIVISNPPPEDAPWVEECSIVLVYELNENDLSNYLGWSADDIQGTIYDCLYPEFNGFSALDDVECIIDTAEFMEDEEEAVKCAKKCEEQYDEEYNGDYYENRVSG